MTWIKAAFFALLLGHVGEVPLHYGAAVWIASEKHGVDAFDTGSILIAEHAGHGPYLPDERGRYRGGGELGLLQLKAVWALEATERCNARMRRGHHRHSGLGDCLWIEPDRRVVHAVGDLSPRRRRGKRGLDEAFVNIEAGVIAFAYLKTVHAERYRYVFDWRALFRCSPRAWKHPSRTHRQREALERCRRSVARVERYRRRLTGRTR